MFNPTNKESYRVLKPTSRRVLSQIFLMQNLTVMTTEDISLKWKRYKMNNSLYDEQLSLKRTDVD